MTIYRSKLSLGDVVVDYAVLRGGRWSDGGIEMIEADPVQPVCATEDDLVQIIVDCRTGKRTRAGTLQNYTVIFEDGLPRAVRNGVPNGKFWPAAKLRNFGGYDLPREEFERFDAEKFMEMYAQAMPVVTRELQRAYVAADDPERRALRKAMRYGAGLELENHGSA